jgi:hypothetical protein
VTLTVDNQKNGQRGDTVHQEACGSDFCPVRSTAALVSAIMAQAMPLTTPLSYVQPGIHVQPPMILLDVRRGARLANLEASGYDLTRVGAHSLRASGAMALWLSGHSPEAIMKMGQWRTQTFLTYNNSQIAALTTGTSQKMGCSVKFHNVGGNLAHDCTIDSIGSCISLHLIIPGFHRFPGWPPRRQMYPICSMGPNSGTESGISSRAPAACRGTLPGVGGCVLGAVCRAK